MARNAHFHVRFFKVGESEQSADMDDHRVECHGLRRIFPVLPRDKCRLIARIMYRRRRETVCGGKYQFPLGENINRTYERSYLQSLQIYKYQEDKE